MPTRSSNPGFPIKIAALRSGLTQHIIRAWEKRYGAVCPGRSQTQRRVYSEEEIERLSLLRQATAAGHSIGNIVHLADSCLRKMVAEGPEAPRAKERLECCLARQLADCLEAAFSSVLSLDGCGLERELHHSLVAHGRTAVMQQVLVPLMKKIGEGWEKGELRVAHEHVASSVIRTLLGNFVRSHSETSCAPCLLVTTPSGQIHELGALLAAATAVDHGWRVIYLGPNLPPEETAGAFLQAKADAVAISIVYPGDDPALVNQLRLLRRLLPPETPILAGGRATHDYEGALRETGTVICPDLNAFTAELARIRRQRAARCGAS